MNNFKKERGYTKSLKSSCGASKSQSLLTTRPSPVPTPPPITGPSQPQKPHQPTYSQIKQVNLLMICFSCHLYLCDSGANTVIIIFFLCSCLFQSYSVFCYILLSSPLFRTLSSTTQTSQTRCRCLGRLL